MLTLVGFVPGQRLVRAVGECCHAESCSAKLSAPVAPLCVIAAGREQAGTKAADGGVSGGAGLDFVLTVLKEALAASGQPSERERGELVGHETVQLEQPRMATTSERRVPLCRQWQA